MHSSTFGERRRFTRVEFEAEARLTQAGVNHPGQLLDISVRGITLRLTGDAVDSVNGEPADLSLTLADGAVIQMQVGLVHRNGHDFGFRCDSIDLESAAHLRRLVELNMATPDAAEQVLAELLVLEGR